MCGIIALDQETGAFGVGVIAANFGGRDSTIGTSSFKTSMKFFQLKISLKPLRQKKEKTITTLWNQSNLSNFFVWNRWESVPSICPKGMMI